MPVLADRLVVILYRSMDFWLAKIDKSLIHEWIFLGFELCFFQIYRLHFIQQSLNGHFFGESFVEDFAIYGAWISALKG